MILQHIAKIRTETLPPEHSDRLDTQYWHAEALLATAQAHAAILILERNIRLYPRTTLAQLQRIKHGIKLLQDIYEALDDLNDIKRLEVMLEDIDIQIAK